MKTPAPRVPGSVQGGPDSLDPALQRDLTRLVGPRGVITQPGRLMTYESDALTRFRQLPRAVVLPRNTEEAAGVVRLLVEAGVPLTPRGAGTGLSGGGVASPGAVVLGTSRMNRILSLNAPRRLARVQAGVVNTDLSIAAEPFGLHYAPDPSSQAACTLGGNVGENAGGPHCLKYGVTTRYVTGLTVVSGRGEVMELGGADRCEDLDLVGLFVGSEGRLGLATEIELRLVPRPRGVRTLLAAFGSTEAAGTAVSDIIASGLLPAAMEIMDRGSIEAVEASIYAAGYPTDAEAVLVVEFDGTEAGLEAEAEAAEQLCRAAGATQLRRARTEAERQRLWQGRKKAYGAFGRIAPDLMVQDATVPRSALPGVLARIGEIGRRHGLRVANVFHAGDGNLHPKLLFDRRDPGLVERVELASKEIMQVCVDAGGTITGEHGVGLDKRDYMHLVHGPQELEAMRAIQRVFDPTGAWNPGKVLPDPDPAASPGPPGPITGALETGAVVRPSSVDELTEILSTASRRGIPARIRGRPPGHEATGPGMSTGITVRTDGLSAEVQHAPADLTVTVGAGCTVEVLREGLAEAGQWLPLDLPGADAWTLGEVVARGEWGPLAPAYGRVSDLLLGAELVTGDGRRLGLGGRVMKNVAGFDLVRGVVGSRGRWGVLNSLTFRLAPLPRAQAVLAWEADREEARALTRQLATHPILPASVVRIVREWTDGVWLRLLGSEATVAAELEEFTSAIPGARIWTSAPDGPDFLARDPLSQALSEAGLPGTEPAVLLEARPGRGEPAWIEDRLREAFPGADGIWHLPLAHVWRVPLISVESAAVQRALDGLEPALREVGGDLCVLRGTRDAGGSASGRRMSDLESRVCAVFDPAGVLNGAATGPREA